MHLVANQLTDLSANLPASVIAKLRCRMDAAMNSAMAVRGGSMKITMFLGARLLALEHAWSMLGACLEQGTKKKIKMNFGLSPDFAW